MAEFIEKVEYKYEIVPPFSIIQCRRADIVEKDGVEIARNHSRFSRAPGEIVDTDPVELQNIAAAIWTPELITAYTEYVAASASAQEFPAVA